MTSEEFEDFFRLVYPSLVQYARRRYDPDIAEDLAARALEKIWTKGVAGPSDEKSFRQLRSLAFMILAGYLGHAARDKRSERRLVEAYLAEHKVGLVVPDVSAEISERDWPEWARELTDADRELLGLVVDGYKPADIAPILGIKASAVTTRLQRAKRRAQTLWEKGVHHGE